MPKVSVLMPVYNGEKYLREAINSILNQVFSDFEFLIIDDGSTDNTLDIIHSYKDRRIRIIHTSQNMGITKALNMGLFLAEGQYIARMDSDDISLPERILKQNVFLDQNPEVVVVGSYMNMIDSQGASSDYQYQYPLIHEDIVNLMLIQNPLGHPSVMFRRFEVMRVGGYRTMTAWENVSTEDYDLWLRIAAQNHQLANLPESLINYRKHSNSLTEIAFSNSTFVSGFNNCFYISAPDLYGCSAEELKMLREKNHHLSILIFVSIAKHLSKKSKLPFIQRLKSDSFISSMQSLTSNRDVISRLTIAYLKKDSIKSMLKEFILIYKQLLSKLKFHIRLLHIFH